MGERESGLVPFVAIVSDSQPIQTQDYLWAAALMTAPANVTLSCGTSSQQFAVPKGVSKLKMPLATTSSCDISATVIRKTIGILKFRPTGFVFNSQPPSYNFNAFVAASP